MKFEGLGLGLSSDLLEASKSVLEGSAEYKKFFDGALKKFGVNSPADFKSDEEKKKFFDYVDKNYDAKNEGTLPPALQKAIDKKKGKEDDKEVDEGATPSKKFIKVK
jgi:hypothetical protein